jgi:CBS domain-containing protein
MAREEHMLCRDIMRHDVQWVLPDITVALAAKLMESYNLSLLPVCGADSRPLGVLTDRDIALRVVANDREAILTRVDGVMTSPPHFVSPETPAARVAEVMSHEGTSRLLVIDDEGNLDGIVSLSDLLTIVPSDVPAELALSAVRSIWSWEMLPRSSVGGQVPSVEPSDFEAAPGDGSMTEIENPAREEAETVVRGGTNELKEFPG